jgi:N-acetylglucosaminyl-diphospho-decaprenol L-rhamnosyltransferase
VKTLVDVGIVTWNTAELSANAIGRLLGADDGYELRVLVHDNHSSDGTVERLREVLPDAQVVAGERNVGFAAGMNLLLRRSEAPWFLALNSDAWPEPGAIGALVAAAERDRRVAAVAPLLLRPDGSVEHSTHRFPSTVTAVIDAVDGRRWMPEKYLRSQLLEGAWQQDVARDVDWAVGAALLMRRQAIEEIGGFDERFFMYVEDLEWCWRANRNGWKIAFEPAAVVRHVGGASGERRFGEGRLALEEQNLRLLLPEALGPGRARLYFALRVSSCARAYLRARLAGRTGEAMAWKSRLRAIAGLERPPVLDRSTKRSEGDLCPVTLGARPEVSVVVPTRNRAESLDRLLRGLETQSLGIDRFEVLVVDDASTDETPALLEKLTAEGHLLIRTSRHDVRRGPAAARNSAWREARSEVVAFTDDDCVPDVRWLECGLAALAGTSGVVVGRTEPPSEQAGLAREPFARSLRVDSARFFETCNVFYAKADLEAVGGFDERFRRPSGEDTELGLRVTGLGVEARFAPDALVYHDVRRGGVLDALRETRRWADLPLVLRGRPWARRSLAHRWVFWKPSHPVALLAVAGLAMAPRWRGSLALVVPWLDHRLRKDPVTEDVAGRIRSLPGAFAIDVFETAVMARGSLRHRSLLL